MMHFNRTFTSIIFSKAAKSIYLGISLFISTILFRKIGSSPNCIWYVLIILNLISIDFISKDLNKTQ